MSQDNELIQDELATLKGRADMLGVQYHPSIGVDKLREKVATAMARKPGSTESVTPQAAAPVVAGKKVETLGEKRKRLKLEASELVRIRITCMNPAKKDWKGEIFSVGNAAVGTFKKFIPFVGTEEGWHVPRIMLQALQDRQCQVFVTVKAKNGVAVKTGKLIKEFAIEVLPQLTETELHDLAQRQAMAKSV
jgi:hypothetical protein